MFDKYGRGVLTWVELSGIMKSLGFPDVSPSLLLRAKIENIPTNSVGIDNKELQKLLHSEEMHAALDYTFNKHNSTYNIRVIKKIISILVSGMLTIDEIRESRMSFMLHEGELCSGITLDERSLLASLRVTGKAIAPKKLQEWIKQLTPDAVNKVQLYEYLDLIKICENKDEVKKQVPLSNTDIKKNDTGLYDITDQNFLLTPDQKLLKKMDDDYENMVQMLQAQSQSLPGKEKNSKDISSTNNAREKSKASSKIENQLETYMQIKNAIHETSTELKRARVSVTLNQTNNNNTSHLPSIDPNKRVNHNTTLGGLTDDLNNLSVQNNEEANLEENGVFPDSTEIHQRRNWNKIEKIAKDPEFAARNAPSPNGKTRTRKGKD